MGDRKRKKRERKKEKMPKAFCVNYTGRCACVMRTNIIVMPRFTLFTANYYLNALDARLVMCSSFYICVSPDEVTSFGINTLKIKQNAVDMRFVIER